MLLTKKHLGRPDFGRFLSGICCWGKQGGFGDCRKKSCNLLFEDRRTRNGVCTVLVLLSTSIFVNRFVVVIYLVPVCKVCFRAAQSSIPERCTFRLEPAAMECPFLQVQLLIVAIQTVEQECSQGIAKEGGKGLPSAFCSLSVFVEEH